MFLHRHMLAFVFMGGFPGWVARSVDMEDIPQQSCTVVTLRAGERATLLHDVAQCLREEFFEVPSLSYTLQGGEVNLVRCNFSTFCSV